MSRGNIDQLVQIAFLDEKENLTTLPRSGHNISVHYTGRLPNGTVFDSSVSRGQPFSFPLGGGRVIQCWDHAVTKIPIGRKARVVCAPEVAYGQRGVPGAIPPNSPLIFDIEVLRQE